MPGHAKLPVCPPCGFGSPGAGSVVASEGVGKLAGSLSPIPPVVRSKLDGGASDMLIHTRAYLSASPVAALDALGADSSEELAHNYSEAPTSLSLTSWGAIGCYGVAIQMLARLLAL